MKHYGAEPPWAGTPQFGYAWQRGPELWDGTTEWTLVYRGRGRPQPHADQQHHA